MNDTNSHLYDQIARAIEYIRDHAEEQPELETIAREVHMSPFHFQRLFTEWAGVSPKKFLQYITIERAKRFLADKHSLFDTALATGLSGTSRLHDLFIQIEGMTPGEYKHGGAALEICYDWTDSPFGPLLTASTGKGICHMAFAKAGDAADRHSADMFRHAALRELQARFPNAKYKQASDPIQQRATAIFDRDDNHQTGKIKLHLKGTDFQLKVWNALLRVPMGALTTYKELAGVIRHPTAMRAVGSAVGDNPVAFLIPCHRVIRSTGVIGEYHWGSTRKTAMIGWEAARGGRTEPVEANS